MRCRLALLAFVALFAALQASAAELTFQRLVAPGGSVEATRTALSPDGRHLYATFEQLGGIAVYERDAVTGSLGFVEEHAAVGALGTIGVPTEAIVTPDGRFVIVATSGGVLVARRDTADGSLELVELETAGFDVAHVDTPSLAQSSDGAHVYAGTSAGRVLVFSRNATTGALTHVETEDDAASTARHFSFVRDLAISPDGEFVYVACDTEGAIVYFARNPISGELSWLGDADAIAEPSQMEFSPDGTRFFAGIREGTARINVYDRDVATGAIDWVGDTAYAASSAFPALAIEPDGSHVFGTGDSAIVSVLADNGGGFVTTELPLLEDGVAGVGLPVDLVGITVSPDGRHAYASGDEGSIAVFAVATYDFLEAETDDASTPGLASVSNLALSADGRNLYATGAAEDAIQVLSRDTQTGALSGSQVVRDGVAGVSGLDGVRDVVVSPSGANVYAVSETDDAAVSFTRNASGQLVFLGAAQDGVAGAHLDGAYALAISPDGKNVYVASDVDDAVSVFGVVPETGELSPGGFFTDGASGVDGLAGARSIAVSPDGKHVYAGGFGDDAIAIFSRDPFIGSLQFVDTVSASGLGGITDIAIAPEGAHVYATGFDDDALVRFMRNPTTGALTSPSVTSHATGVADGRDGPRSLSISHDGERLFVTGAGSVLAIYRRNTEVGTLKLVQAETDDLRTNQLLGNVRSPVSSPNGRNLYVAAPIADAVVAFVPEPEAAWLGLVAAIAVGSIRRMGARAC